MTSITVVATMRQDANFTRCTLLYGVRRFVAMTPFLVNTNIHSYLHGMNKKGLFLSILFAFAFILFVLTREHWQALAKYLFFALIAGIVIRPLGLYVGDFLRRMAEKDKSNPS